MKKRLLILEFLLIILLFALIFYYSKNDFPKSKHFINNLSKEKVLKSSGEYYNPKYNREYIININEIRLENKEIDNEYQFVYMADLQASIIDEKEEDQQIRDSLEQRYNDFVSQNRNRIRTRRNF